MNEGIKKYFADFGYDKFGPLLLNFSKWLLNELEKRQIKKVYFLARDGFVLKQAFDLINSTSIESYYLYGSRRSLIVPTLWKLSHPIEIFDVITMSNKISISNFLKKVGLEDYDLDDELKKYNLNKDSYINTQKPQNNIIQFLDDIFIIIKNNSKNEYKCLMKYLENMNFFGKVGIVDIGWHGTMQNSLNKLLDNVDICGFYIGCESKYDNEKEQGFLFDNIAQENYQKIKHFISLFEFMFLSREGSTKRFVNNDKFIELYDYEYENTIESTIVNIIQSNAYLYIKDNYLLNKNIINNCYCISDFLHTLLYPKMYEAQYFGNLMFLDNSKKYIAKPKKTIYYITHPKLFKNDYINSAWRIGFLKRLFRIPFNYYVLNSFIRKTFYRKKVTIENEKILKLIDNASVISFDIYDTLIFRKYDTLKEKYNMIEKIYNNSNNNNNKINCFALNRINAEKTARQKSNKYEVTLLDIYNELNYPEDIKNQLIELEKEFEVDISYTNKEIKKIYDYCIIKNKRIIITSDMYLDLDTIKRILIKNKIYNDSIYLSSKYNLTKANGNMFNYVIKNENIKPRKLLHIGDNKKSDYFRPRLKGIKCIRIK